MADLKGAIQSRVKLLEESEAREAELQREVADIKEQNDTCMIEIDNLTRKIGMQNVEYERMSKRLQGIRDKFSKAEQEREKHTENSSEAMSQEQVIDELESELFGLQAQVQEKETKLNELEMRQQKMKNDMTLLKPKLEISKVKAAEVAKNYEELKIQADQCLGAGYDDDEELATLRETEGQAREIDVQNDDLRRQILLKTSRISALRVTLQGIEGEIQKLKQEMDTSADDLLK